MGGTGGWRWPITATITEKFYCRLRAMGTRRRIGAQIPESRKALLGWKEFEMEVVRDTG